MMQKDAIQRLFLVGCPRSGTTLLQSLVAAHPQVFSLPETRFFRRLRPQRRLFQLMNLPSRAAAAYLHGLAAEHGINKDEVGLGSARLLGRRSAARAFVRVLDVLAQREGCSAWLEKTPLHLFEIPTIERHVPGARFIHLIRPGPETVGSLVDVARRYPDQWSGPGQVDGCVDLWNRCIIETARHRGKPRHTVVFYQELIAEPEAVLSRLFQFAGLPDHRDAPQSRRHASDRLYRSSSEPWKRGVDGAIAPPASKFDTVLLPEERKQAIERLEPLRRHFPEMREVQAPASDGAKALVE